MGTYPVFVPCSLFGLSSVGVQPGVESRFARGIRILCRFFHRASTWAVSCHLAVLIVSCEIMLPAVGLDTKHTPRFLPSERGQS